MILRKFNKVTKNSDKISFYVVLVKDKMTGYLCFSDNFVFYMTRPVLRTVI